MEMSRVDESQKFPNEFRWTSGQTIEKSNKKANRQADRFGKKLRKLVDWRGSFAWNALNRGRYQYFVCHDINIYRSHTSICMDRCCWCRVINVGECKRVTSGAEVIQ